MMRWAAGWLRARAKMARVDERGDAMVIWCLGIAILLLPIGGISVDLWHAVSQERALQTAASSAADAGASGIDVPTYRAGGQAILDPSTATSLAETNLVDQTNVPPLTSPPAITVAGDGGHITVTLHEDVHLTLLGIVEGNHPIHITATGSATPRPSGAP
jgi:Flp pilus assembly protein TadG